MAKMERFEIKEFGAFKFIGKTVYAPPGSGEIFGSLWGNSKEIFETLDSLAQYAVRTQAIFLTGILYCNFCKRTLAGFIGLHTIMAAAKKIYSVIQWAGLCGQILLCLTVLTISRFQNNL